MSPRPLHVRVTPQTREQLRSIHGRGLSAAFRGALDDPRGVDWTPRAKSASITLWLGADDWARLDALAEAHGLSRQDAARRILESMISPHAASR